MIATRLNIALTNLSSFLNLSPGIWSVMLAPNWNEKAGLKLSLESSIIIPKQQLWMSQQSKVCTIRNFAQLRKIGTSKCTVVPVNKKSLGPTNESTAQKSTNLSILRPAMSISAVN